MTDFWTSKDTLNVIIEIISGLIIGIVASFYSASYYERLVNKRKRNVLLEKYGFLQSTEDEFDWQHWKIENGKIAESPIESYMNLKYKGDKTFSFKWEDKNCKENGSGFIYWDEVFYGKMSFFESEKKWFDYRNVYYEKITHQEKEYDAIFVNADDQGTKYVMLRISVIV
ncbi:MAG: hypothetical protein JST50_19830 [Bacteroidetes bacterium]|jgi:hypothetical protein|nr:hypothetical protein [Bacteroidota bacterium]